MGAEPPGDFDEDRQDDWGLWVLDHGLPGLPGAAESGEAFPVAVWAGPKFGVVLFRSQRDGDSERQIDEFEVTYARTRDGWEPSSFDSGTSGHGCDALRPVDNPPRAAVIAGMFAHGDVAGRILHLGAEAHVIELTERSGTTTQPVVASLGICPVCFDSDDRPLLRVLDRSGIAMLTVRLDAVDGQPPS